MPHRKKSIGKRTKSEKLHLKKDQEDTENVTELKGTQSQVSKTLTEAENLQKRKDARELEYSELLYFFSEYDSKFWVKRSIMWENECWDRYIYMSRELNPLSLPDVNAYLSEWDEDDVYTIGHIFDQCHKSQKICEEIKMALLKCPNIGFKTLKAWMESITYLHFMMRKKIEIATFLILRAANEYVNDESFNMEFCKRDTFEAVNGSENITLCLWGNLSKNIRHKGLDIASLGFSFELPSELLKISCAVRILHTSFDNITHIFCESSVPLHWKLGEKSVQVSYNEYYLKEIFDEMDSALYNEKMSQFEETCNLVLTDAVSAAAKQQLADIKGSGKMELDKNPDTMIFTPPEEPDITVVEKSEFFVVGGIYHFDLFQLPSPTVKAGSWIFTHCEKKVLIHIPYQTSIIPIRHPKPDMSPALAAEFADSEIKRFDREMCNALTISLKLPDDVLFLEQPIPAFWLEDRKGFTRVGFFETKLDEDTGRIFFKTNHFGIIGLLQRKYNNMPYQSWELTPGDEKNSTILNIVGMHVAVKIQVRQGECCIFQIEQDGKLLFHETYMIWMRPEYLMKNLLSMGINIMVETDISKYTEIIPKHGGWMVLAVWPQVQILPGVESNLQLGWMSCDFHFMEDILENKTYSYMSLFCHEYTFSWSKWNVSIQANQLVMRYNAKGNPQMFYRHVLVTEDRAMDVKASETHSKFSDEPIDDEKYFSNLYHMLKHNAEKPISRADDFEFVNTVFFLLSSCKLFSCS